MIPILVFAGLAIVLFSAAFFSKRRFGLLGLALTAGATLSTIWSYDAGLLVSATGLVPDGPMTQAVTLSLVTLLPAILLFFHGSTYKKIFPRLVGSILFMVLAVAFLIEPIGYVLPLEGLGAQTYQQLKDNKDTIISIGVGLAVVDLFFTKPTRKLEKESKRK